MRCPGGVLGVEGQHLWVRTVGARCGWGTRAMEMGCPRTCGLGASPGCMLTLDWGRFRGAGVGGSVGASLLEVQFAPGW